jgi:hypothetical protein
MPEMPIDVTPLPAGPTRRQRYMFWVILACLSAFFAETISGSFPYSFVHPLGWVLVVPLYGLHTLVLAFVVFKVGRPRFSTLFIAGCIFGMYEAYVTKVLWNPPWETLADPVSRLGGVAVVELGVISFCWHPFMAFIVPLAVALTLTSSPGLLEAMPGRLARWLRHREWTFLVALAVWAGLVMGSQVYPLTAVAANAITMLAMMLLVRRFMADTGGRFTMDQLLPDQREVMWLLGALLLYFGLTGPLMRAEALPGLVPQLIVVLIYVALIYLLKRSIDRGNLEGPVSPWRPSLDMGRSLTLFGIYVAVAVATSVMAMLLLGPFFLILSWFAWGAIAILSLGHSVLDSFRGGAPSGEGTSELQPSD